METSPVTFSIGRHGASSPVAAPPFLTDLEEAKEEARPQRCVVARLFRSQIAPASSAAPDLGSSGGEIRLRGPKIPGRPVLRQ